MFALAECFALLSGGSGAVLGGPWGKCQRGVWAHMSDALAGDRALPDCVDWLQPKPLRQSSCQQHHQPCTQKEVVCVIVRQSTYICCLHISSLIHKLLRWTYTYTRRFLINLEFSIIKAFQILLTMLSLLSLLLYLQHNPLSLNWWYMSPSGQGRAEGWKKLKERKTMWTLSSRSPGSLKRVSGYTDPRKEGYKSVTSLFTVKLYIAVLCRAYFCIFWIFCKYYTTVSNTKQSLFSLRTWKESLGLGRLMSSPVRKRKHTQWKSFNHYLIKKDTLPQLCHLCQCLSETENWSLSQNPH